MPTKNKIKRDKLLGDFNSLIVWAKELDITQPDWETFQKELHQLWPSKSIKLPGVEITISAWIPPLWEEGDGLENEPVTWDLSIINNTCMKDEFYKEYPDKDLFLNSLAVLGDVIKKDPFIDWESCIEKFKRALVSC